MKRNSLNQQRQSLIALRKQRKNLTFINPDQQNQNIDHNKKLHFLKDYMLSHYIVTQIFDTTIMEKISKKMEQIEMRKIVDQTMKDCENLFTQQNWQINPNGPFNQKVKQVQLKPDEQPKVANYDPILGFDKPKFYRQQIIHTQSSIPVSKAANSPKSKKTIQFNNLQNGEYIKSSALSNRSNRSNKSLGTKLIPQIIGKLIPLRQQNQQTPDVPSRRNLQDFLRQKIFSKQHMSSHKKKPLFEEKQNLKVIPQIKLTTQTKSFKDQNINKQNLPKLPLISTRQDFTHDYDGQSIQLKKQSHLKNNTKILKSAYKVLDAPNQNQRSFFKTSQKQKSRLKNEVIKLKPIINRHDSINLRTLTTRNVCQNDIKIQIQNKLLTNRVKFRQLGENQDFRFTMLTNQDNQKQIIGHVNVNNNCYNKTCSTQKNYIINKKV